jgi:hypothetical protein
MSWRPFLLRAILSLALVLNGTTSAIAAAHMAAPHAEVAIKAEQAPKMAMADCPDHHPAAGHHGQASEDAAPATPDCCKSSTCQCACVHCPCPPLTTTAAAFVALNPEAAVRELALGHPAPALPHLIRPPIG